MSNRERFNWLTVLPYGSDAAPFLTGEPTQWIPAGLNSSFVAGDDMNGTGPNWPRFVSLWTDSAMGKASVTGNDNPDSGLPDEFGQTVDVRIPREQRIIKLPRDYNRMRAPGYRGHVDEDQG